MIHSLFSAVVLAAALAHGVAHATLLLGDPDSGKAVHERHCIDCHAARYGNDGTEIYTRPNRIVNSIEGLIGQVERCNRMIGVGLGEDEVNDLIAYLNETFYRFE